MPEHPPRVSRPDGLATPSVEPSLGGPGDVSARACASFVVLVLLEQLRVGCDLALREPGGRSAHAQERAKAYDRLLSPWRHRRGKRTKVYKDGCLLPQVGDVSASL